MDISYNRTYRSNDRDIVRLGNAPRLYHPQITLPPGTVMATGAFSNRHRRYSIDTTTADRNPEFKNVAIPRSLPIDGSHLKIMVAHTIQSALFEKYTVDGKAPDANCVEALYASIDNAAFSTICNPNVHDSWFPDQAMDF
jgi:hypothetical protein